ncbi:MAG: CBS domain-containing protein [Proteobacteria bacterium]|nr:CBS domain-containing protein [Pseudomonadota bacterium]MDA1059192.1 CBS domain-containing protein [Pseudomonadota bacterium]
MYVSALLANKGADVVTARPDTTIGNAVNLLAEKKIGVLVISGDGTSIDGILSERDIVRGLADQGSRISSIPASELMSRSVVTCAPTDTISSLMVLMTERRIRHLPVIESGALIGIVSIGDIVKHRIAEIESEAEALRQYVAQA